MSVNPSVALFGVAKQASKGTAASTPEYVHGLLGGTPFQVAESTEVVNVSCGVRANIEAFKSTQAVAADIETESYADVLGFYLAAAMGTDTVTGSAAPYTHTITMGSTTPWLTAWAQIDGGSVKKLADAKIDQIVLDWGESQRLLKAGITMPALSGSYGSSTFPGSVTPSCFDGCFTCTGGTFKLSVNSGTPAVYAGVVKSGQLTIANNITTSYGAASVAPASINAGKLNTSGQMSVIIPDEGFHRTLHTGTVSGTALSSSILYGSFEWDFVHTVNSAWSFKVEAGHVPFTISDIAVQPDGSEVEATLSWDDCLITSASGSPVQFTLVNAVDEY